jgi:general secretion pathway protein I
MGDERGFSLMEALVALLIIGIAAAGIIRATQTHVDSIRDLELRAAAQWVAENRLVELGLVGEDRTGVESTVDMLGRRWMVTTTIRGSEDPDLRLAMVRVRAAGATAPLVTLDGFIDAGTVTR